MNGRTFLVVVVAVALLAPFGCGGKKSSGAANFGDAELGEVVTVKGTLSLRGGTPHTFVMLETDEGGVVVIQPGELQMELRTLAGMRVSVDGRVMPSIDGESPLIDATRYELLALPSGEVPLVGKLSLRGEQCVLETADGKLYWVRGDFATVLKGYAGAAVWVVGTVGDVALPEKPEGSVPIQVIGYGVLTQPQ